MRLVSKKNSETTANRNRRRCTHSSTAAFFFRTTLLSALLLTGCAPGQLSDNLELTSSYTDGGLEVIARWHSLPAMLEEPSAVESSEDFSYSLILRTEDLLAGRFNLRREFSIGYDPYNGVYYFEDYDRDEQQLFYTSEGLAERLEEGIAFRVSRGQLGEMMHSPLQIEVQARRLRLDRNSVFARWFRLFNLYEDKARQMLTVSQDQR